ncbi:PH domain-containing protein [Mycobacterium sp. CBMA293]|uniref:PH domain-containing protein n=1 Tax=unclassified Mycolicibacterium TaxID=2636767 RepID=UPI0013265AB7|nr:MULTISPECIES: PH domain-containing protein [unclassified Mycolicibacterium]MUL49741.1 PH domain-containing protein [Mycolicibacterium sp. CBMA 360]MUL94935.1 PH domain-containing protein [Mycolicibacterium sp. CBMA 230]MUM30654.1 PH domain-containing protein [Mycolicibacterium sp. CBMA 361]MUL59567.1 PH domain-containing protein [Mycolicibacterium sp. CBMA 335]MUL71292.1 PH domain-containing protein [Mycolicibacterium sp. CBMA 311]
MQQTQWSPPAAGIAACGVFGLLLAAVALTSVTDPPGRLLGGIAAIGLLVFATLSWRARPKLAITPAGLVVRGWFGTQTYTQADLKSVRITEFRRLTRKVRLLELDTTDDRLLVFTRWDVGTDPINVLDALTDAGYIP